MSAKTHKTPMERVKKPEGRLDRLAAMLITEGVTRANNPAMKQAWDQVRGDTERLLSETLGPRTKAGRRAKKIARAFSGVFQEVCRP